MNSYTQKPLPNLNEAMENVLQTLADFVANPTEASFYTEYSPQIVTTNEIYQIYELKNHIQPGAKVLTACGSGEQPLFFKLYGADDVITFDISYNSYLLTCLKIAALQTFKTSKEFTQFLCELKYHVKFKRLLHTPKIHYVIPKLGDIEKRHLVCTDGFNIPVFLDDISCQFYEIPQQDYEKLRGLVKSPFPFIWKNILDLDKELNDNKFDIIYYSNILDFIDDYKIIPLLENTKKHVNNNGKIFFVVKNKSASPIVDIAHDVFDSNNWDTSFAVSEKEQTFKLLIIKNKQLTK